MKGKLLVILLFPIVGFSQIGLKLTAEYSINRFDVQGINQFVSTFNNFWGAKLSQPFEEFKGTEFSHPNFGTSVMYFTPGNVGFTMSSGFLLGKSRYQHQATWSNGVVNEMAFRVRDLMWTATMGIHIKNTVFMETYIDANGRKMSMEYAAIYQDGSRSISSEYKLNGLYSGTVASFDYGFQVGLRYKSLMVYVRPSWAAKNFPPAKGLVTLQDYNSNNYPPNDFPMDYTTYATDPIGFVEQNLGVKMDDFEQFRLAFGVEFILGGN
jgi:hypothetical protein